MKPTPEQQNIINNDLGRAFIFPDGLTRWVINISKRFYRHTVWLHQESNTWFPGSYHRPDQWPTPDQITETPAPAPGTTINLCLSGTIKQVTVRDPFALIGPSPLANLRPKDNAP